MIDNKYALITAAKNEDKYIENTIKSVVAQTILPIQWIIVSDGSTDNTDEIVSSYSAKFNFIKLIRKSANSSDKVNFVSKVQAIKMGYDMLANIDHDFIGILDADVTFDPFYYENILNKFHNDAKLGIAGGIIFDQYFNHCIRRSPSNTNYVSGCIQLYRRKCYEDIGGLVPIKEGGEDTIAAITAQMKGWKVAAFEEYKVFHHKHSRTIQSKLKESYRAGRMFYALGSHPAFEVLKCIKSMTVKPYLLSAMTRMLGFIYSYVRKEERIVSTEFIKFLRSEQLNKLKKLFSTVENNK